MINNFDTDMVLTSGHCIIILCSLMVLYGFWKIFRVIAKSRRSEFCSYNFSKIVVEKKPDVKEGDDAQVSLLNFGDEKPR